MNITFIGFGNMAKSIADGLLKNPLYNLRAAAPSLSIGTNEQGIHTHHDNLAILPNTNILILAVKPAQMSEVVSKIATAIPSNCVIISIAAGLNLTWFAHYFSNTPIVRAMPNIGASTGKSATPLCANAFVTQNNRDDVSQLFQSIGLTTWISDETLIDAFTALSGSGPAYVFLFMEAMINAAVKLGIDEDIANHFALQTVNGALSLATESNISLSKLREKVTSPGGTTAAAIEVFTTHGFSDLIYDAMRAACERARSLS